MANLQFPVNDVLKVPHPHFSQEMPRLREQIELGNYCLLGDRGYVPDTSKVAYLVEPEQSRDLNWDLNLAFEERIEKCHSLSEKLDNLLRWVQQNVHKFRAPCDQQKLSDLHTDFVCYRGLLTTIMHSVYEQRENWIMAARKYRDTIYMCQFDTDEKRMQEKDKSDFLVRAAAWGYKFEQFLTASEPGGKPAPEKPVNENEEFCSVVRTRLGKTHSLVYGAEVDAVDTKLLESKPQLKHSPQRYVELKTSRRVDNQRQHRSLIRFKMIKWWAQSYLIGIPRVICGFRNDHGIVEEVQSYDLPELVDQANGLWTPRDLLAFLDSFLNFVKRNSREQTGSGLVTVYEFVTGNRRINCMTLREGQPQFENFNFLPSWYINHMEPCFEK